VEGSIIPNGTDLPVEIFFQESLKSVNGFFLVLPNQLIKMTFETLLIQKPQIVLIFSGSFDLNHRSLAFFQPGSSGEGF